MIDYIDDYLDFIAEKTSKTRFLYINDPKIN